jgi:hypothetical protein
MSSQMKVLLSTTFLLATVASAQDIPNQFPDGSIAPTAETLQTALADKVFSVTPAKGPSWRLQYNANGFFFVDVGNFRDSGKWNTKDGLLCVEAKQIRTGCSELRIKDGTLYLKRDSGEIVKYEQK